MLGSVYIYIVFWFFFQCPIIKERRRFTDVMDEESERIRESRLEAWGREDFSVFKPHKVLGEGESSVEVTPMLQ